MIAIDANLLLYAYNTEADEHELAKEWLEDAFTSAPMVGLPLVCVLAFIRISTDRRLSEAAQSPKRASDIVNGWLSRDNVQILEPGPRHWPIFFDALVDTAATGPRVSDVHLAALAIEHGCEFFTNDRDFRVFPQLDVRFPLHDSAS